MITEGTDTDDGRMRICVFIRGKNRKFEVKPNAKEIALILARAISDFI